MRKLTALFALPLLAAAFCAPLAAQEDDPLEDTVAAVEKAAAEAPAEAAEIAVPAAPAAQAPKAPAAKPAPVIPVWGPQTAAADAEWDFLRAAAGENEKDVAEMVLPQLDDWLARNPDSGLAPDAQLLKARLHERLGDYRFALIDLLKHVHLYSAASSEEAKKYFGELLARKGDKKTRPAMEKAAAAPETAASDFNLAAMLRGLSAQAGEEYYEPLLSEYRYFFNRFPKFPANDEMRLALADLHALEGKDLAARLWYEKMITMHPSSPLLARAKLSLAGTLADRLKEYDKAIDVYNDITVSFPGTEQAWAAYGRLPALAEKQKKYALAVETYEKIMQLYPEKDEAYESYRSEARVLREKLGKPAEAVAVLNRLADKYKAPRAVEALLLAAEIYRKDLKDDAGEVSMYERIASGFDKDPEAPKALYAAGEIFFKAKDADKARSYYQKILELYPDDAMSKKAEKRVAAIISGKY